MCDLGGILSLFGHLKVKIDKNRQNQEEAEEARQRESRALT